MTERPGIDRSLARLAHELRAEWDATDPRPGVVRWPEAEIKALRMGSAKSRLLGWRILIPIEWGPGAVRDPRTP